MDSVPHAADRAQSTSRGSANGSSNPNGSPTLSSTTQLSSPIPISGPAPKHEPEHGRSAILTGIYVVLMIYLGMIVAVLPWKEAWTENSLIIGLPTVRQILAHNFVRGLVSGLGLVDIWLGVSEAASFRVRKS